VSEEDRSGTSLENAVADSRLPRLRFIDRTQMCWHVVDVERLIEDDHPARAVWELIGGLDLTRFLSPIGSINGQAGRPAFDPQLLISVWLYAYSRGISSAREIARRCEYEPAFQWLTGLGQINHHTLSDFRIKHREALDELFTQVLAVLSAENLITLERVMHDGTKIYANASKSSFCSKKRIEAHLKIAREHVARMGELEDTDLPEPRRAKARERVVREREQRLAHALSEYEKIERAKRPGYNRTSKQQTGSSISDPEARIMRHSNAPCALSYNVQLSTDAAAGIVIGMDASQTVPDYEHLVPAVKQIEERLGKRPQQMVVDAGYTSRENVLALHHCGVTMFGRSVQADGRVRQRFARCGVTDGFLPENFHFDSSSNTFLCPEGKVLRPRVPTELPGRTMIRYQASITDCKACAQRTRCCSGNTRYGRSIVVTKENPMVTAFRARTASAEGEAALKQRSVVAEFVNAWLKEKLGLRRFHVRGLAKIRTEAMWAALTYNVLQWITLRWRPRRLAIPLATA
jgi:transposase